MRLPPFRYKRLFLIKDGADRRRCLLYLTPPGLISLAAGTRIDVGRVGQAWVSGACPASG